MPWEPDPVIEASAARLARAADALRRAHVFGTEADRAEALAAYRRVYDDHADLFDTPIDPPPVVGTVDPNGTGPCGAVARCAPQGDEWGDTLTDTLLEATWLQTSGWQPGAPTPPTGWGGRDLMAERCACIHLAHTLGR